MPWPSSRETPLTQSFANAEVTLSGLVASGLNDFGTIDQTPDYTVSGLTIPSFIGDSSGGTSATNINPITGGGGSCQTSTVNAVASLANRSNQHRLAIIAIQNAMNELINGYNDLRVQEVNARSVLNQIIDTLELEAIV